MEAFALSLRSEREIQALVEELSTLCYTTAP